MHTPDCSSLPISPAAFGTDQAQSGQAVPQQDFERWISGSDARPLVSENGHQYCEPDCLMPPDPPSGSDDIPVQAQVRLPHVVEYQTGSALYEWELRAQEALSSLMKRHAPDPSAATDPATCRTDKDRPAADALWKLDAHALDAPADRASSAMAMPGLNSGYAVTGHATALSAEDLAVRQSSPSPWAERLVRILEGPGGTIAVWLRDYRLEGEQVPAIVEKILEMHGGAGIVSRIMINGLEVWQKSTQEHRGI